MVLKETVAQLTNTFPGIPIFPALGNHESAPVNRCVNSGEFVSHLQVVALKKGAPGIMYVFQVYPVL